MWGLLTLFAIALAIIVLGGTLVLTWLLARPPRLTAGRALALGLPTEPEDVGLAGESHTFTLADGVRVPTFIVEGRDPDGPTLLVLHGLLESRYASLARAGVLADSAARLVMPDLRGHGEASKSLCRGGAVEADDTMHLLEQIPGGGALVIHGFSLGAGVALAAAARLPHRPELARWRLVGVIAEGTYRHWHVPLHTFLWSYRVPSIPFVPLLRLIHEPINPELRRFDRATDAAGMTAPLLMIHGERDTLCAPAHARAVADAAGGPVTFETMPGAGHMDVATHDPDRYRAALAGFFADLRHPADPDTLDIPDTPDTPPPRQAHPEAAP